jgi:hypothetical protein
MTLTNRMLRASRALSLGIAVSLAPAASRAAEIDFSSENTLARALMPYAPWIFDLSVQSGRSLAQITYARRGYDPITESFTVDDLHVRRDAMDVSIRQLRVGTDMLMLDDLTVDTRLLDLPPELRDALKRMGKDAVSGDVFIALGMNSPRSAYDVNFRFDFPGIGQMALQATVDGFHVLLPLSDIENANLSNGPAFAGKLLGASIAYKDAGLIDTAAGIGAEEAGVTPAQLLDGIKVMPVAMVGDLLDGLPGGASAQLRELALNWARQAEGFLDDKGAIRVTFTPPEPVDLARIQAGLFDEAMIAALNPSVTRSFDAPVGAQPPAGTLAVAAAQLSGVGAPQDREGGAITLIGLASTGNLDAVRKIASVFGSGPAPSLDEAGRTALYTYLLVARALDASGSYQGLALVGAKLPPEAVRRAEKDAADYFDKNSPQKLLAVSAANIGEFDVGALSARAFALYEGRGVPRNLTKAYALALVASAAGDPFAARLRDDLVAAAQAGNAVVALDEARLEAGLLWSAYQSTHAAK